MKCSVGSGDFSIEELVQHILDRQRQAGHFTPVSSTQPRVTHLCDLAVTSLGAGRRGRKKPGTSPQGRGIVALCSFRPVSHMTRPPPGKPEVRDVL
ncbi:calmodulin-binding transcription activator 2 isoform X1 [Lates japonicus]|uniref:Calmodulin-binding transcription activator 2 isoform X1 n=1 Tax=Lates japonicus TaxID=270547 RepID=A0AAD3RKL3_LATJO|nr:calmodulin-binding transcription activator 2 isoform X1 [Lates japonicus]